MKILLLGVGMQGKAALHDLVNSPAVSHVVAADKDLEMLTDYVTSRRFDAKVTCRHLDASDPAEVDRLASDRPDVIIDLLPVPFIDSVVKAAVKHGCHMVNSFYPTPGMIEHAEEARSKNIAILPEFGLDPGIDLVLLGKALQSFDEIFEIRSYGAGLPEFQAIDNPLKYKVTWTFDGVLNSYCRPCYLIQDGKTVEIPGNEIFNPENVHKLEVEGLGSLEAYPNGDASQYIEPLGIDSEKLRLMGRYSLRWPGHCELWKTLVDLHLLDDELVLVSSHAVDRKKFLAAVIEPHIRLGENQRDIALVRIEVEGTKDGQTQRHIYQVLDLRDLKTGLTAMSRTVGFTVSIGAQFLGTGKISTRGLLSPLRDIPFDLVLDELKKRNVRVTVETS
ncbi:saccharopine dehydrogenase family protein [candidate division KSB1 bacterium]